MEMMMYIGNDCIESTTIDESLITLPGYLGHFVRLLKTKYDCLLQQEKKEPEFLLRHTPVQKQQPIIPLKTGVYLQTLNNGDLRMAV
jgi:hypothetical protein